MYERIVVGTDLSRTARIATDRAAHLAARLEADPADGVKNGPGR